MKILTARNASAAFIFALLGAALLYIRDTYHSVIISQVVTVTITSRQYLGGVFWVDIAALVGVLALFIGVAFALVFLISRDEKKG